MAEKKKFAFLHSILGRHLLNRLYCISHSEISTLCSFVMLLSLYVRIVRSPWRIRV